MIDLSYIKKIRKKQGINVTQMANNSGLCMPTVIDIEANRANPTLSTLGAIASVLDMDLITLLNVCYGIEKLKDNLSEITVSELLEIGGA